MSDAAPSRTEQIVIKLPLSINTAVKVMRGIEDQFPGSKAITRHDHGEGNLVIEVDPDAGPDLEDDDGS